MLFFLCIPSSIFKSMIMYAINVLTHLMSEMVNNSSTTSCLSDLMSEHSWFWSFYALLFFGLWFKM